MTLQTTERRARGRLRLHAGSNQFGIGVTGLQLRPGVDQGVGRQGPSGGDSPRRIRGLEALAAANFFHVTIVENTANGHSNRPVNSLTEAQTRTFDQLLAFCGRRGATTGWLLSVWATCGGFCGCAAAGVSGRPAAG